MPKRPIWLDDFEMEVLGGYVAELLDETEGGELPDYAREVLDKVLQQIEK